MASTANVKPTRLFIPITRTEKRADGLIVEGYCFVNEKVKSDKYNLKRAAMEAAAADYMTWGAIREMHGPNAAGTATADGCGITWDERGAFLRALIVDKDAIEKVNTKVYKGFSVGVQPLVVRGNDVERLDWIENSLVDRPADPDAIFNIARAAGLVGMGEGAEALILEEGEDLPADPLERVERGVFADKIAKRENSSLRGLAMEILYESMDRIVSGRDSEGNATSIDPEKAARESIQEFADYVAPLIAEAAAANKPVPDAIYYGAGIGEDLVSRFADVSREALSLSTERAAAITRAETAEAELATVRTELTTVKEQNTLLQRSADPNQSKPVRIPQALDRAAALGQTDESTNAEQIETLQTELAGLIESTPKEADFSKRQANVVRMQQIKMQIAESSAA